MSQNQEKLGNRGQHKQTIHNDSIENIIFLYQNEDLA